ncbi:MAG: GAF domain-containing protein, partial [Bacillota bacterium]
MSTSLQILTDIARLLNSRADIEAALDEVLRLVTQLLGLRTAWLFLAEPPGRRLSLASAYQLPPALQANGREPLRWRWCRCFELFYRGDLREAVNVLECSRLEQAEGQRCGLVYHASVPLRSSAGVLGVLNVAAEGSTLFDGGALNLLTAVGEHLGTALERSRLFAHERSRAAAYEAVDRVSRALAGPEPDAGDASLEAIGRRFAAACLEAFGLDAVSVAAGD